MKCDAEKQGQGRAFFNFGLIEYVYVDLIYRNNCQIDLHLCKRIFVILDGIKEYWS